MVEINIGKNQGITQAIRDKIGATKVKNADLQTWQAVVKLVDSNPQSQSIFKKQGNNNTQLTTDVNKINDKSSNHSNYVVDEGKVTIDNDIWTKIEKLLTGSKTENVGAKAEIKFNEDLNKSLNEESKEAEFAEIDKRKAQAEFEKSLHANPIQNPLNAKVESKIDTDNINIPVVATGKQLTRSVNGTQQKIEIQNVNGQKVRFAVNDNGTRGEQLVPISTAGKNKYITKSQFDLNVRTALGLDSNTPIPSSDMLTCAYESDGMVSSLVFRDKNGQQINVNKLRTMMTEYKSSLSENDKSVDTKAEIKDCSNLDSKELKKFIKANNGTKIRLNRKTYTISGNHLIDSQGVYFTIGKKAANTSNYYKYTKTRLCYNNLDYKKIFT